MRGRTRPATRYDIAQHGIEMALPADVLLTYDESEDEYFYEDAPPVIRPPAGFVAIPETDHQWFRQRAMVSRFLYIAYEDEPRTPALMARYPHMFPSVFRPSQLRMTPPLSEGGRLYEVMGFDYLLTPSVLETADRQTNPYLSLSQRAQLLLQGLGYVRRLAEDGVTVHVSEDSDNMEPTQLAVRFVTRERVQLRLASLSHGVAVKHPKPMHANLHFVCSRPWSFHRYAATDADRALSAQLHMMHRRTTERLDPSSPTSDAGQLQEAMSFARNVCALFATSATADLEEAARPFLTHTVR